MIKIRHDLIRRHLPGKSSSSRPLPNLQAYPSNEIHSSSQMRTLKAVYPHFSQTNPKGLHHNDAYQDLSGEELKSAMEEAKNEYEKMKDMEKQIKGDYKNLNN